MTRILLTTVVVVLVATGVAFAQEAHPEAADHGTAAKPDHATGVDPAHGGDHHDAGPAIRPDRGNVWPGVVLILVATMFALAAVIGPIARMHAPPVEMPPAHSHDEPPGASHHHGTGGTINPEPGHGHSSGHSHH